MKNLDLPEIENLAKKVRISIIETGYAAGKNAAHFGGALSAVEILSSLYGGIMEVDSKNPAKFPRDILIVSKAHAVLALYSTLAYTGFFPVEDLKTFEADESELSGHPSMNVERGIEFSGGSLGMGLSQGVGVALAYKKKKIDNRILVLLGDGECDEGSNWEAAMSAAHFKLDNLMVIVDKNTVQADGTTDEVMNLGDLAKKFSAFDFETREVDGHNIPELCKNISELISNRNGKPKALIAHTVKGKGISFMENKAEWHHTAINKSQFEQAMSELGIEVQG